MGNHSRPRSVYLQPPDVDVANTLVAAEYHRNVHTAQHLYQITRLLRWSLEFDMQRAMQAVEGAEEDWNETWGYRELVSEELV